MSDAKIRTDIRALLPRVFRNADEALLVEEMEICSGKARADMAIISKQLIGVEIKGSKDTLRRLPNQIDQYSRCFDQVVLVVHESHANKAIQLVPNWWGIVVNSDEKNKMPYSIKRRPELNDNFELESFLMLLWKPELEVLCSKLLNWRPAQRNSKQNLRERLISNAINSQLKEAALGMLRIRKEWRSVRIK